MKYHFIIVQGRRSICRVPKPLIHDSPHDNLDRWSIFTSVDGLRNIRLHFNISTVGSLTNTIFINTCMFQFYFRMNIWVYHPAYVFPAFSSSTASLTTMKTYFNIKIPNLSVEFILYTLRITRDISCPWGRSIILHENVKCKICLDRSVYTPRIILSTGSLHRLLYFSSCNVWFIRRINLFRCLS